MTEGVIVAIAGSEVRPVKTAELEDGGAGAGLVGGVALAVDIAGWNIGFILGEQGIWGVRHRIGSYCEF